jgi:60 kDa SS-A/Ro ribonucleoprotein
MKTNKAIRYAETTHGGGQAALHLTPYQQLRRSVLSCLLWEDEFYEDGETIAQRIETLAAEVPVELLARLATEARTLHNLRHVPLLLLRVLAKRGHTLPPEGRTLVSQTITEVIQRPDELTEFLSLYWNGKKSPIAKQVKLGLAKAFQKFGAYQLAKYNRDAAIKLRDVLFLVHAKPKDERQAETWKKLVDGTLESPDTWEVNLSAGKDKKETFERLLREEKLGYLALLRNLRNMVEAGVSRDLVRQGILARKGAERVLPFRYLAAAKAAPAYEPELDQAFLAAAQNLPKLKGRTVVIVDISGSMGANLSAKSDMTRQHAACALASILRECGEDVAIYATAGNDYSRVHATALVPPRRGMALVDAIAAQRTTLGGGGIFLKQVMDFVEKAENGHIARVIVVTDEQDCSNRPEDSPKNARLLGVNNYMLNVASAKNGIGYGKWTHIDGFSENIVQWIYETEQSNANQ